MLLNNICIYYCMRVRAVASFQNLVEVPLLSKLYEIIY